MALTQKISRKKSSESIVQPRKAARKVCRWDRVSRRKSFRTDIYARIAGHNRSHNCQRTHFDECETRQQGGAHAICESMQMVYETGSLDSGTVNQDSNFPSKAGLLEPDSNCCNKSQSIS